MLSKEIAGAFYWGSLIKVSDAYHEQFKPYVRDQFYIHCRFFDLAALSFFGSPALL